MTTHMTVLAGTTLLGAERNGLWAGRYACDWALGVDDLIAFSQYEARQLLRGEPVTYPTCDHCKVLLDQCLEEGGR